MPTDASSPSGTAGPSIRAHRRTGYQLRMLGFSLLPLVAAAWFLFDGYSTYPRRQRIARAYEAWQAPSWEEAAGRFDWPAGPALAQASDDPLVREAYEFHQAGRTDVKWKALADPRRWPDAPLHGPPGKLYTDGQIRQQRFFGWALVPVGLGLLTYNLLAFRRWVALEGDTLLTSGGERVPLEQITAVDKNRWVSKGIAVVKYQYDAQPRRVVLDDWKFETKPIREIMQRIDEFRGEAPPQGEGSPGEPGVGGAEGPGEADGGR